MDKILSQQDMIEFFDELKQLEAQYIKWTGELPKRLVISPEIIRSLSRVEGFYQRPELKAEVTAYSPMVRYFKLNQCVVTLAEDYEEKFIHFE